MEDLAQAKKIMIEEDCTCVLCGAGVVHKSHRRGVAPLLQLLDEGANTAGFSAADRVVGKATAFLYCLLGVKAVYARVMSKPAGQVLEAAGVEVTWEKLVEGIQNRQKDGPCPMEHATRNCETPEAAITAIRETLERLR